ncbi:MAG: SulP family inorganic anion transporter [Solirubrobacteraceae bacterium]|nr:SulP family inorganic anion transporter [Patulibacter sp.]
MSATPATPARPAIPRELLAGLVTALALIPETISFSIVAGVDPRVGLLSSFTFSVVIAVAGGRPAMVSAAAGSMALVVVPLVREHGPAYLAAATVMAGAFQLLLSQLGAPKLLSSLPRGVAIGFVNGLAILIFLAQLRHVISTTVFVLVVVGVALMAVARIRSVRVPPSLLSTALLTALAVAFSLGVPTVGDEGTLPHGLPAFALPHLPDLAHALVVILPYAVSLAVVGLIESLLTADLIDRLTATSTSRKREAAGQGLANIATGFFGGQPGCAMIGQSLLNVDTGGRGRVSTLAAGAWLLVLVVALHPLMEILPMAALVATMVFVAFTTFDWRSVSPARLRHWPRIETATMVLTTAVVVATSNLAYGVAAGAIVACAYFFQAFRRGRVLVTRRPAPEGDLDVHHVHGALFFASTGHLLDVFEDAGGTGALRIDLSAAELLDTSAVLALDELTQRHRAAGREVDVVGLSASSEALDSRVRSGV